MRRGAVNGEGEGGAVSSNCVVQVDQPVYELERAVPASASSPILPVCAQLAALALPDPVAELPGLLDLLSTVADPRDRRGVRHGLVTVLAVSVVRWPLAPGHW